MSLYARPPDGSGEPPLGPIERALRSIERLDGAQADHQAPGDPAASLELVARAQSGDRLALDELFRRYQEPVRRMARIRMGPRIRAFMESSDLAQNTFVVAERKLADFRPESRAAIVNWLARILENQIRDANDYANAERRNREREVRIHGQDSVDVSLDPRAPDLSPSRIVAGRELEEIQDACLQELDGDQREVILLRDFAHGSWEFIAAQLGRPSPDAAMKLYARARMLLARKMRARGQTDPTHD